MKNKLVCNGVNVGNAKRQEHDFYATDPKAVYEIISKHKFDNNILEPMAGQGHIAETLRKNGFNVTTNELYDYDYATDYKLDIFDPNLPKFNGDIISNPPYKDCHKYVKRCLELVNNGKQVCLMLKVTFLEGITRYNQIFKDNPPKIVYVATKRVRCPKNADFESKPNDAMCFCWFIWEKGFKSDPIIKWFNYGE